MSDPVLRGALRKMRKWTTLTYVEDLALEEWEASRVPGSDFRPLQLDRDGALRAHLVSERTLALVCGKVPVVGSRYDCYEPPKSPALVKSLLADGVITNEELPRLATHDGCLNHKGVKLLTAAVRGLVVADHELVQKTPGFVMPRIDWSVWQLVRLKTMGWDRDVSALVAKALSQMQRALAEGFELDDLSSYFAKPLASSPKDRDPDRAHKGVQVMAITLASATVDEALSRFALMARLAAGTCAGSLPHAQGVARTAKETAEKAFATAFLLPLATVGSTWLADFRPRENPLHEAIQWAFDNTRVHCVEEALRLLESGVGDGSARGNAWGSFALWRALSTSTTPRTWEKPSISTRQGATPCFVRGKRPGILGPGGLARRAEPQAESPHDACG